MYTYYRLDDKCIQYRNAKLTLGDESIKIIYVKNIIIYL